jgi:hypothetical protein
VSALAHINTLTAHLKNVVFLVGLISVTFSALMSGTSYVAFKFVWPMLIEELRSELNVATKTDIERIQADIRELSGDDRIFKDLPATYILEPVTQGDPIQMILAIERTEYGLPCTFIDGTPLFTDSRDIPFPGKPILPIKQVSTQAERLPLTLYAPEALQPGRIVVVLSMRYSCPFGKDGAMIDVFEETREHPFQMDPRASVSK